MEIFIVLVHDNTAPHSIDLMGWVGDGLIHILEHVNQMFLTTNVHCMSIVIQHRCTKRDVTFNIMDPKTVWEVNEISQL